VVETTAALFSDSFDLTQLSCIELSCEQTQKTKAYGKEKTATESSQKKPSRRQLKALHITPFKGSKREQENIHPLSYSFYIKIKGLPWSHFQWITPLPRFDLGNEKNRARGEASGFGLVGAKFQSKRQPPQILG